MVTVFCTREYFYIFPIVFLSASFSIKISNLVSWCFELSQPLGVTSGLLHQNHTQWLYNYGLLSSSLYSWTCATTMSTHTHTHTYAHTHVCTRARARTHTHTHTYAHIYTHVYTHIYAHTHTRMHARTYTRTNTRTHTQTLNTMSWRVSVDRKHGRRRGHWGVDTEEDVGLLHLSTLFNGSIVPATSEG